MEMTSLQGLEDALLLEELVACCRCVQSNVCIFMYGTAFIVQHQFGYHYEYELICMN